MVRSRKQKGSEIFSKFGTVLNPISGFGKGRMRDSIMKRGSYGRMSVFEDYIKKHSLFFFGSRFNLAYVSRLGRREFLNFEKLSRNNHIASDQSSLAFSNKYRSVRVQSKVGPRLNLRFNALLARLCSSGRKGLARRVLEETLFVIDDIVRRRRIGIKNQRGTVKLRKVRKKGASSVLLNSVLRRLEPPFEIRFNRRRWGRTVYPSPVWKHRQVFLSVKILVFGAIFYQRLHKCPFAVALAQEVISVYLGSVQYDSFSLKIFDKFLKVGFKTSSNWRRFVKSV